MGCNNSKAKQEEAEQKQDQEARDETTTRDIEESAARGAPEPIVLSRGVNPRARPLHEDSSVGALLRSVVKTNEGAVYAVSAPGTTVDCLFLYPAYADVAGKRAQKVFGARAVTRKPAAEAVEDSPAPAASADSSDSDSDSGFFGKFTNAIQDVVEDVQDAIAGDDGASKPSDEKAKDPQQPEEVPVATEGVVCELKEFNTVDDADKPWYRHPSNGLIPGVYRMESAGAAGAWATLEVPNSLQQRWVMPSGHRRAGAFDSDPSIPQRILRAWRALEADEAGNGNAFIRGLVEVIAAVRKRAPASVLLAGHDAHSLARHHPTPEALAAFAETIRRAPVDVDATVLALLNAMSEDGLGAFETVHQMPIGTPFDAIRCVLAFIEASFLGNWFEVAVEAEFEIGTHYFKTKDATARRRTKHTLFDKVMKKLLNEAYDMVEETEKKVREGVKKSGQNSIFAAFATATAGGEKSNEDEEEDGIMADAAAFVKRVEKLLRTLFADLASIAEQDLETFDVAMHGISASFDKLRVEKTKKDGGDSDGSVEVEYDEIPTPDHLRDGPAIEKTFAEWRAADALPLETRRRDFYAAETARIAEAIKNEEGGAARIGKQVLRRPLLMPRHFHTVRFVIAFPRLSDHAGSRKPAVGAALTIWPDGCRALEQTVPMADFALPNGGIEKENAIVEAVADLYDNGDDSISSDEDDDPRAKWVEYPSGEWRGYECAVEVAAGVPYAYNFELDGIVFLDHNSFDHKHGKKREYFRRVRFEQHARPSTFNPLKVVGLVA